MARSQWVNIKQSKNFYIKNYRHLINVMLVSCGINFLLSILIYFVYMSRPEHDFYSTNGVTAPVKLKPMLGANESSVALLPPDPVDNSLAKTIPE